MVGKSVSQDFGARARARAHAGARAHAHAGARAHARARAHAHARAQKCLKTQCFS